MDKMNLNNKAARIINFAKHQKLKTSYKHKPVKKHMKRRTHIIAITSGKGGVGKTNIVANLGYALRKSGKKVLILDSDFGLGNLDVLLGLAPRYNLSHVISGEKKVSQIILDGPGGIKILPAASGIQELTNLNNEQKLKIINNIDSIIGDYDFLLIDTAAGITSNVLYFNVSAQQIVVVVTPEPTSITDAYALMKVLSLQYNEKNFKLLVNCVADELEAREVFNQISKVADRFLNISIEYLGKVAGDKNVKIGVKKQKIISELAPASPASQDFKVLAKKMSRFESRIIADGESCFFTENFVNKFADAPF